MAKKSKASAEDFFLTLSTLVYKSGFELISELETKGMRAGHFKGVMYVHLQNWEEEGYVSHRVRETDNAGLPHLEYIRTEGKFSPFEKYLTDLILQS